MFSRKEKNCFESHQKAHCLLAEQDDAIMLVSTYYSKFVSLQIGGAFFIVVLLSDIKREGGNHHQDRLGGRGTKSNIMFLIGNNSG